MNEFLVVAPGIGGRVETNSQKIYAALAKKAVANFVTISESCVSFEAEIIWRSRK
jgi:hypothetical protein